MVRHDEDGFIRATLTYLGIIFAAILLIAAMHGCGYVSQNFEDGYQVGDISDGIRQDVAWYCGDGMMGMRKVARVLASLLTGRPIADVCKAKDIILETG